jgi:cephalosporin hydroxylase
MDEGRYQNFGERHFASILPESPVFWKSVKAAKWSANGKCGVSWSGVRLLKDPFTLSLYSSLLWEVRPLTIVEFGAFEGGSACWLSDVMAAFHCDVTIISFDRDLRQINGLRPNISYRQLDTSVLDQANIMTIRDVISLAIRPLLVLEDAHANVCNLLTTVALDMLEGDYLVVEDTCDVSKHNAMALFIAQQSDRFMVDTRYTDNFGYNATWNWNSFLRCMKSI